MVIRVQVVAIAFGWNILDNFFRKLVNIFSGILLWYYSSEQRDVVWNTTGKFTVNLKCLFINYLYVFQTKYCKKHIQNFF